MCYLRHVYSLKNAQPTATRCRLLRLMMCLKLLLIGDLSEYSQDNPQATVKNPQDDDKRFCAELTKVLKILYNKLFRSILSPKYPSLFYLSLVTL